MSYVYDDGGRSKYYKGSAGDCVCRSISIATGQDYKFIYNLVQNVTGQSPRNGINTSTENFKKLMAVLGFTWVPTANIGSNQSVHFAKGDLPDGRLICSLTKHYVAVVNGQVRDTWDCRYNEFGDLKRIYGYWILNK